MRDLKLFGTEVHPLHPSGMGSMLRCPWRTVMGFLFESSDEGGVAGDTGSAAHVAVREFHMGKEPSACIAAMGAEVRDYPQADLREAAGLFLAYAADRRNQEAKVVYVEEPVAFQISPAPEDPTGSPIQVIGTLDQIRLVNGRHYVYDFKTSKKDPFDLLLNHTFQMAAYCIGASYLVGEPVHPGALILPRRYRADPSNSPVFWHYSWSFGDIEQILAPIRHAVARIRSGDLWHIPGDICTWCPAKSPDICLPKLQQSLKIIRG